MRTSPALSSLSEMGLVPSWDVHLSSEMHVEHTGLYNERTERETEGNSIIDGARSLVPHAQTSQSGIRVLISSSLYSLL